MHNLAGIYNKRTTEVLWIRCNGKAGSFFFFFLPPPSFPFTSSWPHQKLLSSSFTLTQVGRATKAHTHTLARLRICALQSTSGYGPRMLKDAFASTPVCVQEVLCVCICGQMKTSYRVSQVMALLKHVSRAWRFQAAVCVFLRLSYCPHAAASHLYETNVMKFTFTRPGRAFNMKGQIEEMEEDTPGRCAMYSIRGRNLV